MSAAAVTNEFAKMRHLRVGLVAVLMVVAVLGLSLFTVVSSPDFDADSSGAWNALLAGMSLGIPLICPLLLAGILAPLPLGHWAGFTLCMLAINLVVLALHILVSAKVENQLVALGIGVLGCILAVFSRGLPAAAAHLTPWGYYALAKAADYGDGGYIAVGIGYPSMEQLAPRMMSTKAHLLQQRDRVRPVSRGRRLLGMLLDAWYLTMSTVAGGSFAAALYTALNKAPGGELTAVQLLGLKRWIFTGAWAAALLVAIAPALIGTGASLGQRTVYLRPRARSAHGLRSVLRAACVQAAVPTLLYAGFPLALLGPALTLAAVTSVAAGPRGLSYRLSGLGIVDAREPDLAPEPARR